MDQGPNEIKRRRKSRAIRTIAALALLFGGMALFVKRTLHIGRHWLEVEPAISTAVAPRAATYAEVEFDFGRGFADSGWQVYFNEPDESSDRSEYAGGLDEVFASAIDRAVSTLDLAAFELNSDAIRAAIAAAHERGVRVRILTDDVHGLQDERDPHLRDLLALGISVTGDGRSGLMHNKFAIIDQREVWTGSWNYTVNGSYRNNNNVLALASLEAAAAYHDEFDEMYLRGEFGKTSVDDGPISFALGDGEVTIVFAAEADEISALEAEIARARHSIRFMTFVFSLNELADAMLERAAIADVTIEGVFENRNSTASWSQLPALHCAGAAIRQDGNRYILHHKVILIDDVTVITGSFNYSRSAAERNDENIVIIRHAAIAALYRDEWQRIWDSAEALAPDEVNCE